MPLIRPAVLVAATAAVALAPAAPAAAVTPRPIYAFSSACPGADLIPSRANLALVRQATLCLLNRVRVAHHERPLRMNSRLNRSSGSYSRSMVAHDFFAHTSAVNGATVEARLHRVGYLHDNRAWEDGENIAWATGTTATPRQIVDLWMHSPPHRANILTGRFRDIGVGIAVGAPQHLPAGTRAATYTTDFGWIG